MPGCSLGGLCSLSPVPTGQLFSMSVFLLVNAAKRPSSCTFKNRFSVVSASRTAEQSSHQGRFVRARTRPGIDSPRSGHSAPLLLRRLHCAWGKRRRSPKGEDPSGVEEEPWFRHSDNVTLRVEICLHRKVQGKSVCVFGLPRSACSRALSDRSPYSFPSKEDITLCLQIVSFAH